MPFSRRNRRHDTAHYQRQHAHSPHLKRQGGPFAATAFVMLCAFFIMGGVWFLINAIKGQYVGAMFLLVALVVLGVAAYRLRAKAAA